jgi:hypothetical protein
MEETERMIVGYFCMTRRASHVAGHCVRTVTWKKVGGSISTRYGGTSPRVLAKQAAETVMSHET